MGDFYVSFMGYLLMSRFYDVGDGLIGYIELMNEDCEQSQIFLAVEPRSQSRVLENLIVLQLAKKFPTHGGFGVMVNYEVLCLVNIFILRVPEVILLKLVIV